MKIKSIKVSGCPPVTKFHADNLSDVVVIAGGNGIGKTRLFQRILSGLQGNMEGVALAIEATCDDERKLWGKPILDVASYSPRDVEILFSALMSGKMRKNLKGSVLNFESNRTIEQVKPFTWSPDFPDPDNEAVAPGLLFSGLQNRFQDTQHTILKKVQVYNNRIALTVKSEVRHGNETLDLKKFKGKDPLDPFRVAFAQLLGPKKLAEANLHNQSLICEDGGVKFDMKTLSSGEREVVNIAFDVILRNPSDCIIFFDEPELHLHPELSHRLITTLRSIGERNQFFFCTHSPEIISSSLDDTVIFLTPKNGDENQALQVRPDDENRDALGRLGHSVGIISLGKKIVLIEGEDSSMDKKVYGGIIQDQFPSLVLLPSAGKGNIMSFDAIADRILNRSMWGVNFFMLVDRDTVIPGLNPNSQIAVGGRLRYLSKYHLENYFLDEHVLAATLRAMGNEEFDGPEEVNALLKEIAAGYVSLAAALSVNAKFRHDIGNIKITPKGCAGKTADELACLIGDKVEEEKKRVTHGLAREQVIDYVRQRHESLTEMFKGEEWKNEIPGKQILHGFCSKVGVNPGNLRNVYVGQASKSKKDPFSEIIAIFRKFSEM